MAETPVNNRSDTRMPPLLNLDQAAKVLGVVRQYAHRMAQRGELPGQQVGTYWVFRTAVVERVRDEREAAKDAAKAS